MGRLIRTAAAVVAAASVVLAPAGAGPARPLPASANRFEQVGRFEAPVYAVATASQPGRLYVVEQAGRILVLVNGKPRATPREPFTVKGLASFGEDASGELYLMSVDSGDLYRLAQ